ncbi:MAG: succinate dehydrogenase assembly factor 2 [Ghiorsea sp.]
MTESLEQLVRQLRYRLKCQGMLELDAWLAPLNTALEQEEPGTIHAIQSLMTHEATELLAMQKGQKPIPEELQFWLSL